MSDHQIIIALTNPVDSSKDEEFNAWYNDVHLKDLLSLPGMISAKRYRLKKQLRPGDGSFDYQYLAIYETHDIDLTVDAMVKARANFRLSDTLDPGAVTSCYESFYFEAAPE